MTWSHQRGIEPLIAAAEDFKMKHPDVEISWDARSLADFELFPLDQLADKYDFIMIDHPHIGTAYAQNLLLPLDTLLPEAFIQNQGDNAVGYSHVSYQWEGHQWAIAADAAAQFSAYRDDVIDSLGLTVPRTWEDVFKFAEALPEDKKIAIPFVPVHAYSSFFTMCSHFAEDRFWSVGKAVNDDVGVKALKILAKTLSLADQQSFDMDPIQMLDQMASSDHLVYSPLVYGYSIYSVEGYSNEIVKFNNMPSAVGSPKGSMIGGVGLSISSRCAHPEMAAEFIMMATSADYQRGSFAKNSGQPGHRSAWIDEQVNLNTANFYMDTLQTMDEGSMRPRFNGYIEFQAEAGGKIRVFIKEGRQDYSAFVAELNDLFFSYYNKR